MSLVVDWTSPDPAVLGERLAERLRLPRPDPDEARFVFVLVGGVIRVAATGPGGRERITAVSLRSERAAVGGRGPSSGVRLLGAAWATVELERGVRELAAQVGLAPDRFVEAPDERWLGAAARVARHDGSDLVVLEPVTEGRLAAALARFGEGPVAIYLGLPGPAVGAVRPGPLGVGELLPGAPPWGPFTVVLALPATTGDALPAGEPARGEPATGAPGRIGR